MHCQFCNRQTDSKITNSNHQRRCPSNPNRIMEVLTPAGREVIRQQTIAQNKRQWSDPAVISKHKASMKRVAKEKPESYSSSNRGRTKQIIIDGIKFQGRWEVDFYLWAKEQGLDPVKPTIGFGYIWNGSRTYYPDFYIKPLDLYVEVKGYEIDRDRAKWEHFPNTLAIIKETEIKQIKNGIFTVDNLLEKCYNNAMGL